MTAEDMTRGSLRRHLLRYAVPMILGNLLQLTYNAADSVIIGKYLGENALAAVGTSNPVMTLMVLGASGMGIGASVLMGGFYGAGDEKSLRKEFSTTLILSAALSLLIFVPGFALTPQLLRLIRTPEAAIPQAIPYLRILFVGFLFVFPYNILSHAMRSLGDSRTPVLFLGLSCVLNILLDLLFVAGLRLGVHGAGYATALSQAVSVLLCLLRIRRKMPLLRLKKSELTADRTLLRKTLRFGSLTALQQAAQPIGKVFIQSVINLQGTAAIGAFNAVCRVDDFACIPAQSIGSGIMTCTAQNRGAKQEERVRRTFSAGMGIALCYFPLICGAVLLLKRPVMGLLTPDGSAAMAEMGVSYLRVKAWFFLLACVNNAIQGWFRGLGKMTVVLLATALQITVRALCVFLLVPRIGITGEAWGCLIGWSCQLLFEGVLLLRLRKKSLV